MKKLFVLFLLLAGMSFGQVTVAPFTTPQVQFFTANGLPCSGCLLSTFAAGTTTPLVTYSDSLGTVLNTNPILLGSDGVATIYLTSASYKFVLKTAASVIIRTVDNVTWASPLSTFNGITSTGNIIAQPATAATGGANQSSPTFCIDGFYFSVTSLTDQWCLSDVLGPGPAPTSTFTVAHSGSGGAAKFSIPGNFSVGGTTSLKNLEGIRFAADFAGSSTTCGISEAYAALPSTGGEIVLQQGNCSASGWPVTIQKPILLVGQGMGGPNDAGTNASVVAGSSLTNTSTASSFFILSLAAQSSLEGVTFRDFAMIGNKAIGGATAGDCVDINGGNTAQQVRAIKFDNIQCNQPKISGFVIQDGAFIIEFNNTHVDQSGSHCYVLQNGPNSGVNSQIHFIASVGDLCGGNNASFLPGTADGWHISGSTSRSVDITDSTLADSANGVNVVTGATGTNVHVTNSDFETNTVADINLNDGYGHTIIGSTLLGSGAATGRGVLTAMPVGANFTQNQLMMFANNISGHATQDVTIGANQHICTILPQAQNNYTFSDASLTCVKIDSDSTGALIIKTLTGLLPSTAANGSLGSAAAPWNNSFLFGFQSWNEGTAPSATTGTDKCYADSTAHALECSYNNGPFYPMVQARTATGSTVRVASDFTTANNTSLQTIAGLSWTFPAVAGNYSFHCSLLYSQATAAVADQFGIQAATNAPTNIAASALAYSSSSVSTLGTVPTLATTTATPLVTFTPSATTTVFNATLEGTLELAASVNTVNIMVQTSAGADAVTVKRGSYCQLF